MSNTRRWPRDDATKHVSKGCHRQTNEAWPGRKWIWLQSWVVRRTLESLSNNAGGVGLCCYCLSNRAKVNIKNHLPGQRVIVRLARLAASIALTTVKQGGHARFRLSRCGYLRRQVVCIVHLGLWHSIRIGGAVIAACWTCMKLPPPLSDWWKTRQERVCRVKAVLHSSSLSVSSLPF